MTHERIRARREAHEERLPGHSWYSVTDLAKRWGVSPQTVRLIPLDELRYKEFGNGEKLRRRRYRADWVLTYEEATGNRRQAA